LKGEKRAEKKKKKEKEKKEKKEKIGIYLLAIGHLIFVHVIFQKRILFLPAALVLFFRQRKIDEPS